MPHPDGRQYAQLKLSIWSNEPWLGLSVGAKMLYLRIESHSQLSHLGVLDWQPKKLARSIDPSWTAADVEAAGAELVEARFVFIDAETDEVLIRSHIRHDRMLQTWQTATAVYKSWANLASPTLKAALKAEFERLYVQHPEYNTWTHGDLGRWFTELIGVLARPSIPHPIPHGDTPSESAMDTPFRNQEPITNKLTTLAQQAARVSIEQEQSTDEGGEVVEVSSGRRVRMRKAEVDDWFAVFWAIYPKKKSKQVAWGRFNTRMQSGIDPGEILIGAKRVAAEVERGLVKLQFVPYPASWLNAHGWKDETEAAELVASVPETALQRSIDAQREFMRLQQNSILR